MAQNSDAKRTAVRFAVTLPTSVDDRIEEVSEETGLTKSEIVRRALLRDLSLSEHRKAGSRILIEDPDGSVRYLEFID